jgi:hypothetical protein
MDLAGRVRRILSETDLSDPDEIARCIVDDLPANQWREVLVSILPGYVRQRMAAERAFTTPPSAQQVLTRSAKVTGITEWWRQVLEDRVMTVAGHKRLADCTRDDLEHMAKDLRARAARFIGKAERYERLRDNLILEGREVVGALSVETLRTLLGTLPDGSTGVPEEL